METRSVMSGGCRCAPSLLARALAVSCAVSCSTTDRFAGDADAGALGGTDAGDERDAAVPADAGEGAGTGVLGAKCASTAECEMGLECDVEMDQSFPATGLPPQVDEVPSSVFPEGSCTPFPAAPFDMMGSSCDPDMPRGAQGCDDGVCVPIGVVANDQVETWFACRPACDPADAAGCGRFGYTCDYVYEACMEGCQSDEECQLQIVDANQDGVREFAYDDESRAYCDPEAFRCVHDGGADAETGSPCVRLDDCEANGVCIENLQGWGGFAWPGGYCTKLGCDLPENGCAGDGATCAPLRTWSVGVVTASACLRACTVGQEAEADRLGAGGHGEGCREGYRCHYNGGAGAASGVCVGGNYNAVAESNVGKACSVHGECYSPYGLGQCLTLSVGPVQAASGVCTILDCAVPGLPEDVCGDGSVCLGLNGDRSFCIQTCVEATDCADGFACADDDGDGGTAKVCFPACYGDEDCRKGGEICEFPLDPSTNMTATVGLCSPA